MKQYKFKCPICGKWHDIIMYDMDYWAALCDSHAEDNIKPHRFEVAHRTLVKVIKILYNLGIYVAEDCEKLKWNKDNNCSQDVFIKNKAYYYVCFQHRPGYYTPTIRDIETDKALSIDMATKSLKGAKAKCQADFQKRRAR